MCSLKMSSLQNLNAHDKVIIIADTRHTQRWSERQVDPMLCQGDLAFFCNCLVTLEHMRLWAHESTPGIPRNVNDLEIFEFADLLGAIAEDQHLTRCAQVCFTSTEEDQAEQCDRGTIDEVLGDQDMEQGGDALEEADREADLLEQMPPPGHREPEKERLASWLRLPRGARVAIRRLHRNLRHLPKEALLQMLRAARAAQDYINAGKTFRCHGCDNTKPRPQTHKVSPPRPCTFNHEVGVDVFEIVDSVGMRFSIVNAVCTGTTYDQSWIVRESENLGSHRHMHVYLFSYMA